MLIWKGWGAIVAIIAIVCLLGAQQIAGAAWGSQWQAIALVVAAFVTFLVDRFFLGEQTQVNPQSGETRVIKKAHSLFFIPVKFWPLILFALAVYIYFAV